MYNDSCVCRHCLPLDLLCAIHVCAVTACPCPWIYCVRFMCVPSLLALDFPRRFDLPRTPKANFSYYNLIIIIISAAAPMRPRTTPFPEEKIILGVIYGVLRWADINAATPLGAWGRSVIGGAHQHTCQHTSQSAPTPPAHVNTHQRHALRVSVHSHTADAVPKGTLPYSFIRSRLPPPIHIALMVFTT